MVVVFCKNLKGSFFILSKLPKLEMVSSADQHNWVEVKRCPPELETRSEFAPRELYATFDAFTGCDHLLCLASSGINSLEYSGRGGILYEPGT
jgi:hypothetical protein